MAIKKYLKLDSEKGYLEDKDDINYFATSQLQKVAFGKMLGDFDENGLYVINKKIVEELIKMPKVIVEMVEDADLIRSKIKADAFFHFILTIEDNKASFKLLEKIHYQSNRDFNSGVYSNINEYVLDEVIIPDKDFDRNAIYQKYNISTDNDGEVLSIFDMDELSLALYYNIIEKLKLNYLVQNQLMMKEKEIESIEADYFENVLILLEEFGDFGKNVKTEVQNDLAEKHNFMIVSKPFFQKTINEVLDSYIDIYVQDLLPEQKEQFLEKFRAIKENYYQKFKALVPIEIFKKSGVRLDVNQVANEEVLGDLSRETKIKGFTSSDVRKIVINDSELQLSINRIKEIVRENEEACVRDNARAKDITTGRKKTAEFYKELESRNKTDLLTDTPLIKTAINASIEENKAEKTNNKTAESSNTKTATSDKSTKETKKETKKEVKKGSKNEKSDSKSNAKTGGKTGGGSSTDKKSDGKKSSTKNTDLADYDYESSGYTDDSIKNNTENKNLNNQPLKSQSDEVREATVDPANAFKRRKIAFPRNKSNAGKVDDVESSFDRLLK